MEEWKEAFVWDEVVLDELIYNLKNEIKFFLGFLQFDFDC